MKIVPTKMVPESTGQKNQSLESDRRLNASGNIIMRGHKTNYKLDLSGSLCNQNKVEEQIDAEPEKKSLMLQ